MKRCTFTLVELLVVIAIISILAGLLLPALSSARQRARLVDCVSRQKQVMLGLLMYSMENDDRLPYGDATHATPTIAGSRFWPIRLMPYLGLGVADTDINHTTMEPVNPAAYAVMQCPGYPKTRVLFGPLYCPFACVSQNPPAITAIAMPSRRVARADGDGACFTYTQGPQTSGTKLVVFDYHNGKFCNVSCVDGHVETLPSNRLFYGEFLYYLDFL